MYEKNITISPEIDLIVTADQVVNHFLEAYSASLFKSQGDLFGGFLQLSGRGVKEYPETLELLRSEKAGESFCNNLIANLGIDIRRTDEAFTKALKGESTPLTYEVAALLGRTLEELTQSEPSTQWKARDSYAKKYAHRKISQFEKKLESGEELTMLQRMGMRDLEDILHT